MKKLSLLLIAVIALGLVVPAAKVLALTTNTQENFKEEQSVVQNNQTGSTGVGVQTIEANAGPDIQGIVGAEVIFNASESLVPENQSARFVWDVGNFVQLEGEQVRHIYNQAGTYTVTLTATADGQTSKDFVQVTIFEKRIVLLTDNITSEDEILELQRLAAREGRLLEIIEDRESSTDFAKEDELANALLEKVKGLQGADIIIDWTTGDTGLNALSKFAQLLTKDTEVVFSDKVIVSLASPIGVVARIAQSTYDVLLPQYLILTVPNALDAVFEAQEADEVLPRVQQTGSELRLIGEFSGRAVKNLTPLNFMSFLVNFMVNRGVPVNSIMLILMLPIIATIFAFARQIIGLRAFGIYIPTIVTVSFLALGLTYGLSVFFVVLVVGTLLRLLMRRIRISYIPRLALVLTGITFAIIGLLALGELTNQPSLGALSIFPILIMVALAEQFVAAQIEQGFRAAVFLISETLILAIATYALVSWDPFQSLILGYPELIFLTIVINVLLGRWTGLRLTEYYRFRQVRKFSKLP